MRAQRSIGTVGKLLYPFHCPCSDTGRANRFDHALRLQPAAPGAAGSGVQAVLQTVGGLGQAAATMRQHVLAPILPIMLHARPTPN